MVDFAGAWLARLYGSDVKKAVKRAIATRWNADPWTLGAVTAAAPGGATARGVLAEPLRDAVWFAGEAVHETRWGTVGGAWESGERAADAVLRRLNGAEEPEVKHEHRRPQSRSRRRRRRRQSE